MGETAVVPTCLFCDQPANTRDELHPIYRLCERDGKIAARARRMGLQAFAQRASREDYRRFCEMQVMDRERLKLGGKIVRYTGFSGGGVVRPRRGRRPRSRRQQTRCSNCEELMPLPEWGGSRRCAPCKEEKRLRALETAKGARRGRDAFFLVVGDPYASYWQHSSHIEYFRYDPRREAVVPKTWGEVLLELGVHYDDIEVGVGVFDFDEGDAPVRAYA